MKYNIMRYEIIEDFFSKSISFNLLKFIYIALICIPKNIKFFKNIFINTEILILKKYGKYIFDNSFSGENDLDIWVNYIRVGRSREFFPLPSFNTGYYREKWMKPKDCEIDPVVHFILIGIKKWYSPLPFFDFQHYVSHNPDVVAAGIEPFFHYIKYGMKERRSACSEADLIGYYEKNPDKFSYTGDVFNIATTRFQKFERLEDGCEEPLAGEFAERIISLPRQKNSTARLSVIIPVYRAKDETMSCIWHVLKSKNKNQFRVIVIDDCSPESDLTENLQKLEEDDRILFHKNKKNKGFVKSINTGIGFTESDDIIILNSDTEVYGNWIDRLHDAAYSDATFGTVTPLTNNGTICSYPHFVRDNNMRLEITYDLIDKIASNLKECKPVVAPTAVGFCVYIKREVLDHIGFFDEISFGTGYGEENDFCRRAIMAGWRNVISPNVFVRHVGSLSFRGERAERAQNALKVLSARYPDYTKDVQEFILTDPLRIYRALIDTERLKHCKRRKSILVISHNRGGGTEQHVLEEISRLKKEGCSVFRMYAAGRASSNILLNHIDAPDVPNLKPMSLITETDEILDFWHEIGITEIHLHHTADFGAEGSIHLTRLLKLFGRPWNIIIHDYLTICPRINLIDSSGKYCQEPDVKTCRDCLENNGSEFGIGDIVKWRNSHLALMEAASNIIVPNDDVSERLLRYWPHLSISVRPHEIVKIGKSISKESEYKKIYRIGTIGTISEIKGLEVLIDCAKHAKLKKLPLEFIVVGCTKDDKRASQAGIKITGSYENDVVHEIIDKIGLDLIFISSVSPETYCYTLSIAMKTGLPIAAFNLGAQMKRLEQSDYQQKLIIPLEFSPEKISNTLINWLKN